MIGICPRRKISKKVGLTQGTKRTFPIQTLGTRSIGMSGFSGFQPGSPFGWGWFGSGTMTDLVMSTMSGAE